MWGEDFSRIILIFSLFTAIVSTIGFFPLFFWRNPRKEKQPLSGLEERKSIDNYWEMAARQATDGLAIIDRKGRFLSVNPSFTNLLGLSETKLENLVFFDLLGQKERAACQEKFRQVFERKLGPFTFEASFREEEGGSVWSKIQVSPLEEDAPSLEKVAVTLYDDANSSSLEESFDLNPRRVFSLFEKMSIGLMALNEEGRFLYANQALLHLSGYTLEELQSKTTFEITHPDDLYQTLEHINFGLAGVGKEYHYEKRVLAKNGKYLWVDVHARSHWEKGQKPCILATCIDITESKKASEVIRDGKERLEVALEGAEMSVWEWSRETGDISFVDDTIYKLLEIQPGSIPVNMEAWRSNIHPEDRPKPHALFTAVVNGELPSFDAYYRIITGKKRIRWVRALAKGLGYDEEGKPWRILGECQDITRVVVAEEALRESQSRYQSLFQSMAEGLAVTRIERSEKGDPIGFPIIEVNPEFERIFETKAESLLGRDLANDQSPHYLHWVQKAKEVVQTGVPWQEEGYIESIGRFVGVNLFLIGENLLGCLCADIHERKQNEKALKRRNRQFDAAKELTKLCEWEFDISRRCYVNTEEIEPILGVFFKKHECHVKEVGERIHPEDLHRTKRAFNDFLQGDQPFDVVFRMLDAHGEIRYYHVIGKKTYDEDGTPKRAFGTFMDVTKQKEIEEKIRVAATEAEAASQAKSAFLANMSHEIRTPMASVLGFAEVLDDSDLDPKERSLAVNTIKRNGRALLDLIDDILDLSKVEAGRMSLEKVEYPLGDLVETLDAMFRLRAEEKRLDLSFVFHDGMPTSIETDPTRLRQILVNLIGNAIKFTETGGIRIELGMVDDKANRKLRVLISDTGVGMSKKQLAKIFDPFTQADSSTTRRFGGTGLGLAITKRLVEMLDGSIEVKSREGMGSQFILHLDPGKMDFSLCEKNISYETRKGNGKISIKEESPARLEKIEGKVLLVEDSPDISRLIQYLLEKRGLSVETAENGLLGVEAACRSRKEGLPFDLVIMDVQMPVMDGLEATRTLRRMDWRGPIISLTAHAMRGDEEKSFAAGADFYLTKPILPDALYKAVCEAMAMASECRSN